METLQVEYRIDQTPSPGPWKYITLYKKSANGADISWQIGFDGINKIQIDYGQVGGIVSHTETEIILNQSGRSMEEQSLLEIRHRYLHKTQEGYRPAGSTEKVLKKGMKGHPFKPTMKLNFPIFVQPKLDGVRMLSEYDSNGNIHMRTYENRQIILDHVRAELEEFIVYLPPGSTIDGELYNHKYASNFSSLISIFKKKGHPNTLDLEYHIFDVDYIDQVTGAPILRDRYTTLANAYNKYCEDRNLRSGIQDPPKYLKIVEGKLAHNYEEIDNLCIDYVSLGYEGIMLKKMQGKDGLYRYSKCNNILKYKPTEDTEGEILDVLPCTGTQEGCGKFKVRGQQPERGGEPGSFLLSMKVPHEEKKKYLRNPENYIGKVVTYKYQSVASNGIPRFPVGIAIRDYE